MLCHHDTSLMHMICTVVKLALENDYHLGELWSGTTCRAWRSWLGGSPCVGRTRVRVRNAGTHLPHIPMPEPLSLAGWKRTNHTYGRIPYTRRAMTAALNSPATGTVTNQATKMFRKRCQSTAFRERIQPTATTEPTLQ